MWLLRTDRAELHYFQRSFDAIGGYAILSHTWDGDREQTLQQVRAIAERCRKKGTNPRDDPKLSSKIRNCCILAEKHGYRWVWIDSCCIDKTSSSELSEAINSMYRWYKEAEVCYAYLADVPHGDVLRAPDSAFRKSRWHTRGWTLQELIAPDSVIFLSAGWREIGTRVALAQLLQEITGIPSRVLASEEKLVSCSLSVRMSWASSRKTRRVEDEAYCLMGLLGVSMPTNYGEGKKAFIRLQYEIMQRHCDMSLFAFGRLITQKDIDEGITFHPQEDVDHGHPWHYLLASSPQELEHGTEYTPDLEKPAAQRYPPPPGYTATGSFDRIELPRATLTSYGVKLRLPIIEVGWITIAVVLCERHRRYLGLFLTRDVKGKDPKRVRYFTGCRYRRPSEVGSKRVARLADLGPDLYNLTFNRRRVNATWRTIYVIPTLFDLDSGSATVPDLIINRNPASRFRIPRWLVCRYIGLHFEVDQIRNTDTLQTIQFLHRSGTHIFVSFGLCAVHPRYINSKDRSPLWAKADVITPSDRLTLTHVHDCSEDHINSESWATGSKVFGSARRRVRLSLTPSTPAFESPLVIYLELFGHSFEKLLREAGISFPPLRAGTDWRSRSPRTYSDKASRSLSHIMSAALRRTSFSISRATISTFSRKLCPPLTRLLNARRDRPLPDNAPASTARSRFAPARPTKASMNQTPHIRPNIYSS